MSQRVANLALLFAGAIWGMGFIAQSTAMDDVGPITFLGARFLIASIVLLPPALFESRKATEQLPLMAFAHFAFIGFILFLAMGAQQIGLLTTTVTNSGVLTGLYVVLVPITGLLLYKHRPHAIVWLSVTLTFVGIALLSGGSLEQLTIGDWLTILCAILSALYVVLISRHVVQHNRPFTFSFIQFTTIAAASAVVIPFIEDIELSAFKFAATEIIYTGVFSSAIAFTIQAVAQRYTTAPQAAIFMSTEVLFAALFGAIFLSEHIGFIGYIGGVLIFSAMILTETIPALRTKNSI